MDTYSAPDGGAITAEQRRRSTKPPGSGGGAGRSDDQAPDVSYAENLFPAQTYGRLAAAVRLVACFAAMQYALFFPDVSGRYVLSSLYSVLILVFAGYTAVLYWRAVSIDTALEGKSVYWLDGLVYLTVTGMTGGADSHYFVFLSFPLLFLSLRWGFASGMWMAVCSSGALAVMGIVQGVTGASGLMPSIVFPPLGLLLLGFLLANWASLDRALNRRLASVKDFNKLFSPRLSFEQIVDRAVRSVASVYTVDRFVLVQGDRDSATTVHRADLVSPMYKVSDAAAHAIAHALSRIDVDGTVLYRAKRGLQPAEIFCSETDVGTKKEELANEADGIAARFGCVDFCMIRFELKHGAEARLLIGSGRPCLNSEDLAYFSQIGQQLSPLLDNVSVVDRLVHEVTDFERRRIARDIHDSTIQPYIGLKFGLEALARRAAGGEPLAKEIGELVELANSEIVQLRQFVKELRDGEETGNADLVPALRRHGLRFGKTYGIRVELETTENIRVGDYLANEVFHMVSEALSNIRRHTTASVASVSLSLNEGSLRLQVANRREGGDPAEMFTPRSIAERARSLGGTCTVEAGRGGDTVVTVELPIQERRDGP